MKRLNLDYGITTVARPVNYIRDLIPRLKVEKKVRLFVGSDEIEYLQRMKRYSCVEIVEPPRKEWLRFKGCSVYQRATWNYWRCLSLWPHAPQRDGLVILEDDVLPAMGWQRWLQVTIQQLNARCGGRYVLALYCCRHLVPDHTRSGYAEYSVHNLAGTQGMYYPESIRVQCGEFLKRNGVELNQAPYDMLLAEFLTRKDIPLFATVPALLQHVGEVSTGL